MEEILQTRVSIEQVLGLGFLGLIVYGLIELVYLYFFRKYEGIKEYKQTSVNFIFTIGMNMVIAAIFGVMSTAVLGLAGYQYALFATELSWHWWIYGLLVYEFFYWVQHWLAHKVRLFWCLHSPHHAPESMNMFVGFNHQFLETFFYMPFFLGFLPAICGVHPIIIISISAVDIIWGNLLHVNDHLVKDGRYGFLEKFLQTPSHH
ncbi:MAG: sterol desaturase family protein, partial [Bacteroidota bacterium]